jgi:hypothetical protein
MLLRKGVMLEGKYGLLEDTSRTAINLGELMGRLG